MQREECASLDEREQSTEKQHDHAHEDQIGVEKPYTVFTKWEKWLITLIMGTSMFFSPMTANIYFPAIPTLASATSSSIQQINLTITTYIVLQGISPLFVGDLADNFGRRPIYLLTFAVYTAASLGLSLNRNSYAALLVLRTLQSAGCSATAAISYGVLADVAMPSTRGAMLGAAMVAANTAPTIGPLLGGVLTGTIGWHWIFWMLTILGTAFLLIVLLAFPETSRKIVDNGSIQPRRLYRPWLSITFRFPRNAVLAPMTENEKTSVIQRFRLPNPVPALRVVFYPDTSLVLWISAAHYAAYYCLQATMPSLFAGDPYNFEPLKVGLTYLCIGIGVALGGFINGRTLDHNYRIIAARIGFTINRTAGDSLTEFPIERARTRFSMLFIPLHAVLLMGYGWVCQEAIHCHVAVPLILQFALGFLQTCIVQTFNTLLVDIFPSNPSTASAAGNITRCALSAGSIAAVNPLLARLRWGWVFTILGLLCGCSGIAASWVLREKGMKWRNHRTR
jgi:MFS family permease